MCRCQKKPPGSPHTARGCFNCGHNETLSQTIQQKSVLQRPASVHYDHFGQIVSLNLPCLPSNDYHQWPATIIFVFNLYRNIWLNVKKKTYILYILVSTDGFNEAALEIKHSQQESIDEISKNNAIWLYPADFMLIIDF